MRRLQPIKMAVEAGDKTLEFKRMVLCKNIGYPFYVVERPPQKKNDDEDEGDDGDYNPNDNVDEGVVKMRTRAAGEGEGKLLASELEHQNKKRMDWDEVL
jgi:hypothetical protein